MTQNGSVVQKSNFACGRDVEVLRRELFPKATDTEWNDWRWQLRNAVTSLENVMAYGKVSGADRSRLARVLEKYPVIIVPYYLCLIDFNDPKDPIRIQSFPMREEVEFEDVGEPDPLEEEEDMVVPGLIHRYPDRVLMQVTNLCPMNCRHCTRKREWEEGLWTRDEQEVDRMIAYLAKASEVRDVLISGGDPLVLATVKLERILAKLRAIPHIEIIRIGTRFPVVLPQRIDRELVEMLSRYRPLWVNTHFNHPREITREAAQACEMLQRGGMPMNNQSVLLRGVNDSLPVMRSLCHELLKIGVRPYYLYQCDPVKGTEHLRTSIWKGIELIEGLRGHTTGFAVPQFVIDAPGGGGKIPIGPNYLLGEVKDGVILRNYEGFVFEYRNPASGMLSRPSLRAKRSNLGVQRLLPRPDPHSVGWGGRHRLGSLPRNDESSRGSERLQRRMNNRAGMAKPVFRKRYHGQRDWLTNGKSKSRTAL